MRFLTVFILIGVVTISIRNDVQAKSEDDVSYKLVRTSVYDVASDAYAIGSSADVHAIFDVERVRFLTVWRGDFLDPDAPTDADPPEIGLRVSNDRWGFTPAMPFSLGNDPVAEWPQTEGAEAGYVFKSAEIGNDGIPVIKYTFNGMQVEERIMPAHGDNGFRREIKITEATETIRYLAAAGAHVDPIANGFELNGAWETRVEAGDAPHSVEAIGGAYAALIYILTPVEGRIEIAQEVEW